MHRVIERADEQDAGVLGLGRHGSSGLMHRRSPVRKIKN
jgi:hypothetical protein